MVEITTRGEPIAVPISVRCVCGKLYAVPDAHAGKRGRCTKCAAIFDVPGVRKTPVPVATAKMSYSCPHCDATLETDVAHRGQVVQCGACREMTVVPIRATPVHLEAVDRDEPEDDEDIDISDITTPMLVSAIFNLLGGMVYTALCVTAVLGIPMVIFSVFEFSLYSRADSMSRKEFARKASGISGLEIVFGLFHLVGLFCGMMVSINAGKLKHRLG